MQRTYLFRFFLLLCFAIRTICCWAQDEAPVIEMRADRVLIYPQRMELSGEESLLDILMMYPDLMQKGFDDLIEGYNLRIDNVAMNGNVRLLCSQVKAKLISKIQVCDNTGVAKGTIGHGRVIDVNLLRLEKGTHGFMGVQGGTENLIAPSAEIRYGSQRTDIYANTSYTHLRQDHSIKNNEYLTLHMTNWFTPRDRLLTYFTQQYTHKRPIVQSGGKDENQKYLGRARYFHTFNDKGSELLLLASYQYNNNPVSDILPNDISRVISTKQKFLMGAVEFTTPLFIPHLDLMIGWEGDWDYRTYSQRDDGLLQKDYIVSNNDLYAQLNYKVGFWRFTLGDRVMFYHYGVDGYSHNDVRNNVESSIIACPNGHNQIQLAYHRKFSNPTFVIRGDITVEDWFLHKGELKAAYIDEAKLGYTYSRQNLSLSSSLAYLAMKEVPNTLRCNVAGYFKTGLFSINAGANVYIMNGEGNDFATFSVAPRLSLPCKLQIMAKGIFVTKNGVPARCQNVYAELQANKQLGRHWDLQLTWHDIFSRNYTAALAGVQYRF